jgi:hypothetical protein
VDNFPIPLDFIIQIKADDAFFLQADWGIDGFGALAVARSAQRWKASSSWRFATTEARSSDCVMLSKLGFIEITS